MIHRFPLAWLMTLIALAAPSAEAARWTLGLRAWGVTWNAEKLSLRVREDWDIGGIEGQDYDTQVERSQAEPSLLWAPELGVQLGPWQVALVARLGRFNLELSGRAETEQSGYRSTATYDFETEVQRWDGELAIRRRMARHLRLQLSYRWSSYRLDPRRFSMERTLQGENLGGTEEQLPAFERRLHGPGIGMAAHLPLGGITYLYGVALFYPWIQADERRDTCGELSFLSVAADDEGTALTAELGFGLLPVGWPVVFSLSGRLERTSIAGSAEVLSGLTVGIAVPF